MTLGMSALPPQSPRETAVIYAIHPLFSNTMCYWERGRVLHLVLKKTKDTHIFLRGLLNSIKMC